MPRNKDVLWEHIAPEGRKVRCKFCHEVFVGGVTRMRYHFAKTKSKDIRPCKLVPDSVRETALKGVQDLESKSKRLKALCLPKSTASSLGSILQSAALGADCDLIPKPTRYAFKKTGRREADKAIVKCIVSNNLPFNLLRSLDFREACIAIANAGSRYEPPSCELACTGLLGELKDEVDVYVHSVKQTWEKYGCTLMLDTCTEGRDVSCLNLLAASPKGVVHLKSLCTVGHTAENQYIIDFISSAIDEIGSQNVIQFISDSVPIYEPACHMIGQKYPNIFKVNCARHCINLIFKDLDSLDHVSFILECVKKIINFIYRHRPLLILIRNANGIDLKETVVTRFSTNFCYLQLALKAEQAIRQMVATVEWGDFPQCKSADGLEVQNMIREDQLWDYGKEVMHAVEPLVKISRMVDDSNSTTGYIYEAMHKAKLAIQKVYKGETDKYMPFWNIIDHRWGKFLHCDLHAAAAYLNPHLFHDGKIKLDSEVKGGLERVIQRMVLDTDARMKITEELRDYHLLDSRIFGQMAIDSLHISHPRIWWDMWGSSVPTLQNLAIKILSQTCSSISCEKNWSSLEATYTSKREQVHLIRLQNLLYVRMNMQLMKTIIKPEKNDSNPIDVDKIEAFPNELEEFDILEYREKSDKEEEESGEEDGTQSEANGFYFTGIL